MTTSRLEHHQRVLLIRQTIIFFGLSLASGLLFLFVILPLFIRILAIRNVGSKLAGDETTIPPQAPTLSQPYTATNSATISLAGTAPSGLTVYLLQNGVEAGKTTVDQTGSFAFQVQLTAGENNLTAVSEDDKGVRSNPSSQVLIALVTDAPKLEVTEPTEGAVFTQFRQQVMSVVGSTNPGNKIFVNDQVVFVATDGSFKGAVTLNPGENKILVRAQDQASNETVKEITVSYTP